MGLAAGTANLFHDDFLLSSISSGFFWVLFGLTARFQYAASAGRQRVRLDPGRRSLGAPPDPEHTPASSVQGPRPRVTRASLVASARAGRSVGPRRAGA